MTWDDSIPVPVETKLDAEHPPKWTIEGLRSGKPLLVYYVVDTDDVDDPNFRFADKFDTSALADDDVVDAVSKGWRARKVTIRRDADHKKPENQARVELWGVTGTKLVTIARDQREKLAAAPFLASLKTSSTESTRLVNAEIVRLEAAAREAKAQAAKAGDGTTKK